MHAPRRAYSNARRRQTIRVNASHHARCQCMRTITMLFAVLLGSACAVEGNGPKASQPESPTPNLPDCDSLPDHVVYGAGNAGPAQTAEPGRTYGASPTQD